MNPYTPPESPVKDPPRLPGSPVKAVLVGLAIDVGGSLLLGTVLTILYATSLAGDGMSEQQIADIMTNIPTDSWLFIVGSLAGAGMSFLGGFWCARIARRSEYRIGAVLAAISALLGLAMSWEAYAPMQNVLITLSTAACVLLGSKYGRVARAA